MLATLAATGAVLVVATWNRLGVDDPSDVASDRRPDQVAVA